MCGAHLLRYLQGHSECVIKFAGSNIDIHCFSNADWGVDVLTRRSTTGYTVFAVDGPISWLSKLQPMVVTLSLESEYMASYANMQELVWLRGVMKELKCYHNPVFHKRSKHIDIKYHWIREHVSPGGKETAKLHHCQTD
jgi:hypothetical protein